MAGAVWGIPVIDQEVAVKVVMDCLMVDTLDCLVVGYTSWADYSSKEVDRELELEREVERCCKCSKGVGNRYD